MYESGFLHVFSTRARASRAAQISIFQECKHSMWFLHRHTLSQRTPGHILVCTSSMFQSLFSSHSNKGYIQVISTCIILSPCSGSRNGVAPFLHFEFSFWRQRYLPSNENQDGKSIGKVTISSTDCEKPPVDVTFASDKLAEPEPYIILDRTQKRLITFVVTIVASCKLLTSRIWNWYRYLRI